MRHGQNYLLAAVSLLSLKSPVSFSSVSSLFQGYRFFERPLSFAMVLCIFRVSMKHQIPKLNRSNFDGTSNGWTPQSKQQVPPKKQTKKGRPQRKLPRTTHILYLQCLSMSLNVPPLSPVVLRRPPSAPGIRLTRSAAFCGSSFGSSAVICCWRSSGAKASGSIRPFALGEVQKARL